MLEPGARLAQYEIHHKLGDGCGGGEVYAATDTELGRSVALKILPPEMAGRRRALEAEAKTIAALDHPNIVRVYGVEEWQGVPFIVRELVDGRTLGDIVASEPVSVERFFQIAVPLTDALGVAHEHGITHRDIAPDNVMLDASGHVKVLDFSMATSPSPSSDGVGVESSTGQGRTVDGALFVSPEQVEGKPADPRSDIFLLGLLWYELLTGRHPFAGATPADRIVALRDQPAPSLLEARPTVPPGLASIVERCLDKDPARRYRNALALSRELQTLRRDLATGKAAAVARPARRGSLGRVAGWILAGGSLALIGYLAGRASTGESAAFDVLSGTYSQLTSDLGLELFPSLSPEGDLVVYASDRDGDWDIYLQRVGGERAINLTGASETDDIHPAFSPDGKTIAFRSERGGGGIFVMGATGEAVRRVADFGFYPSWSPDGTRLAVTTQNVPDPRLRSGRSQLWIVSLNGDEPRRVLEGDAVQPHWSPHGARIAFWSLVGGHRDIRTVDVTGEEPAVAVTADAALDWSPSWSPDGEYLYFSSNRNGAMNLWRVPIDERTGETAGQPVAVTAETASAVQHARFSANGDRLVYASSSSTQNLWKFGFDPNRAVVTSPPSAVTHDTRAFYHPQVSPDGEWVVAAVENEDLFVVRADGTSIRRLTDDDHRNREARFSPDGSRIAFQSDRQGTYDIWSIHLDGSGLTQLTDAPDLTLIAPVWSPSGDRIACWNPRENNVLVFSPATPWKEQTPRVISSPDASKRFFPWSWSSDGKWLAGDLVHPNGEFRGVALYSFESNEVRVLTDFGSGPAFLHDSRRILFVDTDGSLHSTDLAGNTVRIPGAPYVDLIQISRDDRTLFYTDRSERADIWVVTAAP